MRTPGRARAVSAAVVLLLVGGVAMAVARASSSAPTLPPVAPDNLVASVLRALANPGPVSGYVRTHVDLGIPSLPDEGPAGTASTGKTDLISALTGDHRLRVWRSADGLRISDLLPGSERSLYVTRTDAWAWDFGTFTAYHLAPVQAERGGSAERADRGGMELVDPLAAARMSLQAISPTTSVAEGRPVRVAGRSAYVLELTPRTSATLVGRVEVDIDAATRLPLRVAVVARGARGAALSVAYTSIGFGRIDPSVYQFRPPPGATVKRSTTEAASGPGPGQGEYTGLGSAVLVFGTGWASVVALRVERVTALRESVGGAGILKLLPFSGPLFSIRLLHRGDHAWLVYGAVPQAALVAIEPRLH